MSFWSFFTTETSTEINSPYKKEWQKLYPDK